MSFLGFGRVTEEDLESERNKLELKELRRQGKMLDEEAKYNKKMRESLLFRGKETVKNIMGETASSVLRVITLPYRIYGKMADKMIRYVDKNDVSTMAKDFGKSVKVLASVVSYLDSDIIGVVINMLPIDEKEKMAVKAAVNVLCSIEKNSQKVKNIDTAEGMKSLISTTDPVLLETMTAGSEKVVMQAIGNMNGLTEKQKKAAMKLVGEIFRVANQIPLTTVNTNKSTVRRNESDQIAEVLGSLKEEASAKVNTGRGSVSIQTKEAGSAKEMMHKVSEAAKPVEKAQTAKVVPPSQAEYGVSNEAYYD